jgi:hypothetical protein
MQFDFGRSVSARQSLTQCQRSFESMGERKMTHHLLRAEALRARTRSHTTRLDENLETVRRGRRSRDLRFDVGPVPSSSEPARGGHC